MEIPVLEKVEDLSHHLDNSKSKLLVVHFGRPQTGSDYNSTVNDVFQEFLKNKNTFGPTCFLEIHVDKFRDLVQKYDVQMFPTFLMFAKNQLIDKVVGLNISELTKRIKLNVFKHFPLDAPELLGGENDESNLNDRLKQLINKSPIMLFMKGSRDAPRCLFSRKITSILDSIGAKYETFDILQDEEVRQGLKVYSNWPTYPQVYVNGNLIGGLDVIQDLDVSGELKTTLSI